ncbi:hypothetical protein ACFRFU_35595 [Streptomyces sp. NPDC056704]|uniref:hypothetical protein n=1 Tax=Streptomyces sp. NPDC056704 TaxID=3345917 RepID=UPI00368D0324
MPTRHADARGGHIGQGRLAARGVEADGPTAADDDLGATRAVSQVVHAPPAWWAAACKAHGDRDGTRALIEVLLLGRHLHHEYLVTGLAAALRAGALTADAVALEARKAAEVDDAPDVTADPEPDRASVTFLTERRLAHLPPDNRPLPSVAAYDQLLRPRRSADHLAVEGETP